MISGANVRCMENRLCSFGALLLLVSPILKEKPEDAFVRYSCGSSVLQ